MVQSSKRGGAITVTLKHWPWNGGHESAWPVVAHPDAPDCVAGPIPFAFAAPGNAPFVPTHGLGNPPGTCALPINPGLPVPPRGSVAPRLGPLRTGPVQIQVY